MADHQTLTGIGVSVGTAHGPVVQVRPAPKPPAGEEPTTDAAAAGGKVREAMAEVAASLTERASRADDHAKPILEAGAMMAQDPGLAQGIDKHLAEGKGITNAVNDATEEYCAMFESLGGYMAERVTDLRDVRDRTIARLLGVPEPGVPDLEEPSILVALDLAPAETATLTPTTTLGIITQAGGATSHTAILAAQLGIPAVVQVAGALDIPKGTHVAIDGGVGEVIVAPTDAEKEQLAERSRRRAAALSNVRGHGVTKDGTRVQLLANIGTAEDAERAAAEDCEGVGLFRTEVLFLDSDTAPTLEEQQETYERVFRAFGDRKVVVRTLDAGADKPLAFANLGEEENPALGVRGLRLQRRRTDLLETQLDALAAAQKATGGNVWVMAPMVAIREEAQFFADQCRKHGIKVAGTMIEVPAAAIRSTDILEVCDFASLGTNDLSQYTFAADRMQGELAGLLGIWQPALLDIIKMACDGGRITGKPIGVCGEAGGDPLLALVLCGLGVSSLSMAVGKIKAVKTALRLHDLGTCQRMADAARRAKDAKDARQAVIDLADPVMLDLI
ncbi:phosphoenolpyruvate--protein phosphotransferase [Arsenicicoccus piscis]|uniref:Phosphoenolpyruvate-protein phosphotransferase n=1 Tax=Arsenicicoccus piscis TaxID=673954 RepID=A0ABQ6HMV6_9MICO|nr:phosphoenolpyruvate--protein phosphotransferase [Arsenicicoccus piscis]MCH8628601.1 phosphoenolpyruvate--protein phosphotransferase [Arsenicicoccus piscis]GMA19477.1 phosphoenolpyruvate-protein phosphotransferase [Arsenicicoccus piscis]